MVLLAGVCFIDELASGIPSAGAALIRDELETDYAALALLLLVLPQLLAILVETPLLVFADRFPRARVLAASLIALALGMAIAAAFSQPWLVAIALAACAPINGIACGVAQAALSDADPENRERRLAEWTLAGVFGDLAAPGILAALAFVGLGWRAALLVVAVVIVLWALPIARLQLPHPRPENTEEEGSGITLRAALREVRNPRLAAWLFGWALCSLLDETLFVFAALFVRDRLGGDTAAQSAVLAAFTVGSALGLLIMRRLLRTRAPRAILAVSSLGCALAYTAWLASTALVPAIALMFLTGCFASPLYPIASAQAYRAVPDRSSLVAALAVLFTPVDLLAPLAVGWIADTHGIAAALAVLLVQPIGLFAIAVGHGLRRED